MGKKEKGLNNSDEEFFPKAK